MGVENIKGIKTLSDEIILKIYAAVKAAGDFESIIIDDFLKRESREFERDFMRLLSRLEKAGKRVVYLSCEMYNTADSLNGKIIIDTFKVLSLPPLNKITLR